MKKSISEATSYMTAVAIGLTACVSTVAAAETSSSDDQAGKDVLEEVIVTGVTMETKKQDATFSINTLSDQDIQRLAPMSTAELLGNIPGFYSEGSTAGEASNNITVRGLPVTGGYRYAPQLIDGLPAYEEPEAAFMNNDVFVRDDLMTKSVEVVKGGPGGILYSNGLGATVNHVTRTGGDTFEGGYKLELADYGFIRNDLFVSGPINDNLTFAVGGYYRTSDGIRDTGYTADQGGQVRGNVVYTSDDRKTVVEGHALFIDDRTAFYQNLPISVPRITQSGTPSNPTRINQDTIQPLGLDFADGTFSSPGNRRFDMLGEYGTRTVDQADGIHPKFHMLTGKISREFDSGWRLAAGLRYTSGESGFNSVFVGNDTAYASTFLNARLENDVISPAYNAAVNCNLSNAKLIGYFNVPASDPCTAFNGISREQFVSNYARFSGVVGNYLGTDTRVADGAYMNFLLPFIANVDARSSSFDLRAEKTLDLLGTHDVTLGVYRTDFTYDVNFQASLLVSDVATRSRLVDLLVVDANGAQVGPTLTSGAAILPGWFGNVTNEKADGYAVYFLDHWETLADKLRVDWGARWQQLRYNVVRRDRTVLTDLTPASVEVGSTADTTADNEIQFPGEPRFLDETYDDLGWSVGANYSFTPELAVYALVSDAFRLPSTSDVSDLAVASARVVNGERIDIDPVEHIRQYEGGVRYLDPTFDAAIAVFYNEFSPRAQVNVYKDFESSQCTAVGGVPQIDSCPDVAQLYRRGVETIGTELELAWRPGFLQGLELRGSVVYQDPKVNGANYTTVESNVDAGGVITGYRYVPISEDGRRPRRLAKVMVNLRPSYDLRPTTNLPVTLFAQYHYFGSRFSEATDFNVTLYPAYYILNVGAVADLSDHFSMQVNVNNVTDQLSFTEGDPLFPDLLSPDGTRNRGVARPLFGRTIRASLSYRF